MARCRCALSQLASCRRPHAHASHRFSCALSAELIGKADDDVWVHLGGVAAFLRGTSLALQRPPHATPGAPKRTAAISAAARADGPLHDRRLPPQASPLLGQHAQLPLGRPPRSAGWLGLGLGQQAGLQHHEPGRRPWVWGPLDGARRLWHARRPHHGPLPIRDGPPQLPVGAALQAGDMAAPNLSRRLVATAPPHAAMPLARSCWHRSSCHNTWPAP